MVVSLMISTSLLYPNQERCAEGLTDSSEEVEDTVDRSLCALAGDHLVVVDSLAYKAPLHIDRHGCKAETEVADDHMYVYVDRHYHMRDEEENVDKSSAHKGKSDELHDTRLLCDHRREDVANEHYRHRNDHTHRGKIHSAVKMLVEINVKGLAEGLYHTEEEAVHTKCEEGAVYLKGVYDIPKLDYLRIAVVCVGFNVALLGEEVVTEEEGKADNSAHRCADSITRGVVLAVHFYDNGYKTEGKRVSDTRSDTSRRGE